MFVGYIQKRQPYHEEDLDEASSEITATISTPLHSTPMPSTPNHPCHTEAFAINNYKPSTQSDCDDTGNQKTNTKYKTSHTLTPPLAS